MCDCVAGPHGRHADAAKHLAVAHVDHCTVGAVHGSVCPAFPAVATRGHFDEEAGGQVAAAVAPRGRQVQPGESRVLPSVCLRSDRHRRRCGSSVPGLRRACVPGPCRTARCTTVHMHASCLLARVARGLSLSSHDAIPGGWGVRWGRRSVRAYRSIPCPDARRGPLRGRHHRRRLCGPRG